MAGYGKLQKMIQSALKQSAEESSMLLNQELTVNDTEVLEFDKQAYLVDLEDSAFVVPVDSREDYPGRIHLVFSLRDAILMSGILLGIPSGRISEKRKLLILEADDIDAFSEIANQIIGTFNSVFQPLLPNKFHLKQLPPVKFVPQVDEVTDDVPVPDEEYLVYKAQIRLGGDDLNRFDILVPVALAACIDPQEAIPEAACAETAIHDQAESLRRLFPAGEASANPSHNAAAGGFVLVLEDDHDAREDVKGFLLASGFTVKVSHLGADIKDFFAEEEIQAVVLGVKKADEWELSLCSKIKEMSGNPKLPIIVCANQWTRTGVLKALKNGAKDIIMKPYEQNELLGKLGKFHAAA
ncbi:MAG: response regulator [Deltaproteobacteria bacterium]|nr:response regulator [Deltaproteobacteria bacterium]